MKCLGVILCLLLVSCATASRRRYSKADGLESLIDGLRSGRHRRVPEPDPDILGAQQNIRAEQMSNQHKPIFKLCDEYKPSVREESKRGKKKTLAINNYCKTQNKRQFGKLRV